MNLETFLDSINYCEAGDWMYRFIRDLFPICRSITGEGFRETLRRIRRNIPIEISEVRTGTRVFDWTVPREWNIRDAWVKDRNGEKVIDFQKSNLHVVSYSVPVRKRMGLAELRSRLHTLPSQPDLVPYRTTYYEEDWGFCLPHRQLQSLEEGEYEVCIDSSLSDGYLAYGEHLLQGKLRDEVLLSCHACHPSLCNDNLSGVALATLLAKLLDGLSLNYSYRFLFIPGTIGSITWLALNEEAARRIRHGLVIACDGDIGKFTYKRSRQGDADIDRAVIHALQSRSEGLDVLDFSPYGYDERQYCSPGFDLPVGRLTRTPHGRFPEYHTSADNLDLVRPEALAGSLAAYLSVLRILEGDARYRSLNPRCEPQLGKRGLYRSLGGLPERGRLEMAVLWALNLSDGSQSLLDISRRSGIPFEAIQKAARLLVQHDLLQECRD